MKKEYQSAVSMVDGFVIHNRVHPKRHRFKYKMCWGLYDLDQLEHLAKHSKFFSYNKWGLTSLYDQDYIDDSKDGIKTKLINYLANHTNQKFSGEVLLFTHPRFLGYGFNSVNFYFCYQNKKLVYIISEINNTPWGEKHLYFHDCTLSESVTDDVNTLKFNFDKAFHISPFVAMDMSYHWEFMLNNYQLKVNMSVNQNSVNLLNVILDTKITSLMENEQHRMVFKRPFQPWKMSLGIYWQAFKLWLKKVPFHNHPKSNNQ